MGMLRSAEMRPKRPTRRLTRSDWIEAALGALTTGGLEAVSVMGLAEGLGVTKGSFYWHFNSLGELLTATLKHWAVEKTGETINSLEAIAAPRERLRALMSPPAGREVVSRIDIALAPHASDPSVAPWLRRHDDLWLDFAARAYAQAGFTAEEARRWAVLAYSAYLGLVRLVAANPRVLGDEAGIQGYITSVRDKLVPP